MDNNFHDVKDALENLALVTEIKGRYFVTNSVTSNSWQEYMEDKMADFTRANLDEFLEFVRQDLLNRLKHIQESRNRESHEIQDFLDGYSQEE